MSGAVTHIEEIELSSTKDGKISISVVDQPYGADSESVASIGISLKEDSSKPEWKVHIPKENIDAVIAALQIAKQKL
jgi:hypothetical protein